jgi:hypothetical protein
METIASLLMLSAFWVFIASFLVCMGQASGRWESEDWAQYRGYIGRASGRSESGDHYRDFKPTAFIHRVSEDDSVDELIKIMRERHLPYLALVDDNRRMVVTMEDLIWAKKHDPPAPDSLHKAEK